LCNVFVLFVPFTLDARQVRSDLLGALDAAVSTAT
jgi:hypothetical protein